MDQRLKLDKENRDKLIEGIIAYFHEEHDEELGELAAGFLLDYFCEQLGPIYYNQGLRDAHTFINDKLEDLAALEIWNMK